MNILVLNWRDPKHPLAGGAEISLLHHVRYWQKKGHTITWFASGYPHAKNKEIFEGINIVRAGSHFTVSLHFFFYWMRSNFRDSDIIIDCLYD
jgi:hypothetical protein